MSKTVRAVLEDLVSENGAELLKNRLSHPSIDQALKALQEIMDGVIGYGCTHDNRDCNAENNLRQEQRNRLKEIKGEMNMHKYRPLPQGLTIAHSEIEGLGLFTESRVKQGRIFGITHYTENSAEDGQIRTPLGGFINHSDEPNARIYRNERTSYLMAIRDILPGEEITVTYGVIKKDWSSDGISV